MPKVEKKKRFTPYMYKKKILHLLNSRIHFFSDVFAVVAVTWDLGPLSHHHCIKDKYVADEARCIHT